ncbi:hypothetical protein MMYC01_205757 [Madurella mycetomatis]|uniref:DUF4048 domain-containing protein n=1 Tax=Madurella mycetomatis TaxID=100816 RepID=A0A175W1B3_9PEZI|nr:hypothetical protein MMYC01_205757 [Madurella mycetomatis]
MTSVDLVRICFVSACANTLFNKRDNYSLNIHKAIVVARRTTRFTASPCRHRSRRNHLATPASLGHRRKTSWPAYHPDFLRKPQHSFNRQRPHRTPKKHQGMDQMASLQQSLDGTMLSSGGPAPHGGRYPGRGGSSDETRPRRFPDEPLASPPPLVEDLLETRSTRSASTASRSTNRLSLTLPIAPPSAYPSRPTPASTTTATFPPTPLDTPSIMSPVDPNDFITAIAAQERRVLELREELSRAESDLARLKKQWATHEAYKKRAERRGGEPGRGLGPAAELHDETAVRRSVELDRRKALLGQQNQPATPERSRRRVFTGGHTRTLSLLSPTRPSGFGEETESSKPDNASRFAPVTPDLLAKRASWAPRSTQTNGVKQIAQDLRTGLWTFMEDLRQATVGDEPITGQGMYMRGRDGNMKTSLGSADDQDTIRAAGPSSRPRVTSAFEEMTTRAAPSRKQEREAEKDQGMSNEATVSRPNSTLRRSQTDAPKPTKRFSWTPVTIDTFDENDWSNWDSPSTSPRWSGTTVNGDIIPSIPEKRDDDETPLEKKPSKSHIPSRSSSPAPANKLEELLPPVLNRLTPSNIKRTAADFMKEWERSLSQPDMMSATAATAVAKEKGT